jgi:hypothetical protein
MQDKIWPRITRISTDYFFIGQIGFCKEISVIIQKDAIREIRGKKFSCLNLKKVLSMYIFKINGFCHGVIGRKIISQEHGNGRSDLLLIQLLG